MLTITCNTNGTLTIRVLIDSSALDAVVGLSPGPAHIERVALSREEAADIVRELLVPVATTAAAG